MKEKSASGNPAGGPVNPGGGPAGRALPGRPALAARSAGPKRPPDRLSQPSTRSAKKGVRRSRFEVIPPWEWPTSQKAAMFAVPKRSPTSSTMFCRC